MKKIFLLIAIFSMVFTSCEPLEDINAEIDAQESAIFGDVEYTLTDEDYDALELSYGSFSSLDDAKEALPDFLSTKYPVLGKGSSALIGYKLYVGNAFGLKDYSLKQEDYALSGSDLLGFQNNVNPQDYLAGILSNNYSSPEEGDYVAATYFQYTGSAFTVTPTVSFEENFDYGTTAGDLTTISSDNWVNHSGTANQLLYTTESLSMTDYPSNTGGAITLSSAGSEDVNSSFTPITSKMVYTSALINLSEVGDGTYFFHLMEEDGSFAYSARVGAKSDGAGNILFGIGASSSSLTYGTTPFNLGTTYLLVASYNIDNGVSNLYVLTSALESEPLTPEATNTGSAGNTANRIGIRQGGGGPTGTIDGIRVANTWSSIMSNDVLEDEVVGTKVSNKAIYTYNDGAWVLPSTDGFYSISDVDFASMGIETFGSSTSPDNYLPAFLNIKFPYAQEGDVLNVVYDYLSSSSGAQTRGNLYTKTDGVWVGYQSTIDTTLQFAHDGTTWVPDNTIKYELIAADYTLIADTYRNDPDYATAVANLEAYGNISTFNWTTEQIDAAVNTVLNTNFTGMEEGQKFNVTVYVYDGSSHNVSFSYILEGGVYIRN
ncbi:hypothetical protein C7447_101294 [Tenacibaculum adriaticum]|uniref:DUF5017 domain-containing protein n=1 Tax=Tenacibaculum adriaticum TaxID=413713 RepID=A0A5S5DUN6_9FLAO|nr:hypothetical protein [Tenacibaculum adriaticum]TYP99690.1 hypothetical protein C7447_101294 [Tenacibaculum adriaticum]